MATAPPILVWSPAGGVPVGPISNPPVYSQAGTTQLVEDQAYIDVVFGSVQTDDEWVLVECVVVNETDLEPLNIWPGIITDKAAAGFRLQLNGMPDSDNYYLHWAVSGINIAPSPATTFILSGPSSGVVGVAYTFTVQLPPSTTVPTGVTIIPSDSGGGGTFSPITVTLTTGTPSMTFTYTPGSGGTKTISVTNNGDLLNPTPVTFTASTIATGYSMTGPTTGDVSVASTDFTVTLTPLGYTVPVPVTVTPSDSGGGGTFTPTTVTLSTGTPSATFTYTPTSAGAKTISATNSGGLTNPGSLTYTVVVTPHLLNTLISYWKMDEASGNRADAVASNTLLDNNSVLGVAGKINNAAQFVSASSQYFNAVSNSSLQVTSDFTFSLWVKFTSGVAAPEFVFLKQVPGPVTDYALLCDPAVGFAFLVGTVTVATDYATMGTPVTTGVWYHVVVWFDHLTGQVYLRINDTTTYQSTTSPALIQTTGDLLFGCNSVLVGFVDGLVDETGFWKRKLTAIEITTLYNGGAGLPFSSFTT